MKIKGSKIPLHRYHHINGMINMGKLTIPDLPELPELPLLDETDIGKRVGKTFETVGEKLGKRVGSGIGGIITFGVGTINDVLELPRELTKK
jgi:hypothetical protein